MYAHIVESNATPYLPEGWLRVAKHLNQGILNLTRKGEDLLINNQKVELYLAKGQKGRKPMHGAKLFVDLEDKNPLNANVLDYLLEHQELIPESWRQDEHELPRYICFWGTVYLQEENCPCVR